MLCTILDERWKAQNLRFWPPLLLIFTAVHFDTAVLSRVALRGARSRTAAAAAVATGTLHSHERYTSSAGLACRMDGSIFVVFALRSLRLVVRIAPISHSFYCCT